MPKLRLALYSYDLANCPRYDRMFGHEFETEVAQSEEGLLAIAEHNRSDVAVVCFCSSREKDLGTLKRLDSLTGPMPVLVCSKTYNPNFIRLAAQRGVNHFLLCDMEVAEIRRIVFEAVRGSNLRSFLERCYPHSLTSSPHVSRMINEIVYSFPHRPTTGELSSCLGISHRRLQMICQEAFDTTFTHVIRRIWVYHALIMMKSTNLDNGEIASLLEYSEESSLARIIRKELGYSPSEARRRLATQSPETLLA